MRTEWKLLILVAALGLGGGTIYYSMRGGHDSPPDKIALDGRKAESSRLTGDSNKSKKPAETAKPPVPTPPRSNSALDRPAPPRANESSAGAPRTHETSPPSRSPALPPTAHTPDLAHTPGTSPQNSSGNPGGPANPSGPSGPAANPSSPTATPGTSILDRPLTPSGATSRPAIASNPGAPSGSTTTPPAGATPSGGATPAGGSPSPSGTDSSRGAAATPPSPGDPPARPSDSGNRASDAPPRTPPRSGEPAPRPAVGPEPRSSAADPPARGHDTLPGGLSHSAGAKTATYTVKDGDKLWKIAQEQLGDGRLWTKIKDLNPTMDPDHLKIGQVLAMPDRPSAPDARGPDAARPSPGTTGERSPAAPSRSPGGAPPVSPSPGTAAAGNSTTSGEPAGAAPRTYKVSDGDTLTSIARKVLKDGSRWKEIYELNKDKIKDADHVPEGAELKMPEPREPKKKTAAIKKPKHDTEAAPASGGNSEPAARDGSRRPS